MYVCMNYERAYFGNNTNIKMFALACLFPTPMGRKTSFQGKSSRHFFDDFNAKLYIIISK